MGKETEGLMDKRGAMAWAGRVIETNRENLGNPDDLLENHLPMTYDIALETAERISGNYPGLFDNLDLKTEEIALAGGLHDIGRPLGKKDREGQEFHEIRGYWEIRDKGLEEGVADTQEVIDRVAALMLPHGSVYETFVSDDYGEVRERFFEDYVGYVESFGEVTPESLKPSNLGQAIVDYSELSNNKGKRVGYRERLEDAIERYEADVSPRAACIKEGSRRRIALADNVTTLLEGEVKNESLWAIIGNI